MTELDRLKSRRASWIRAQGPGWILKHRRKIIAELDAEIAALEKALGEQPNRHDNQQDKNGQN